MVYLRGYRGDKEEQGGGPGTRRRTAAGPPTKPPPSSGNASRKSVAPSRIYAHIIEANCSRPKLVRSDRQKPADPEFSEYSLLRNFFRSS